MFRCAAAFAASLLRHKQQCWVAEDSPGGGGGDDLELEGPCVPQDLFRQESGWRRPHGYPRPEGTPPHRRLPDAVCQRRQFPPGDGGRRRDRIWQVHPDAPVPPRVGRRQRTRRRHPASQSRCCIRRGQGCRGGRVQGWRTCR